MRAEIKEKKFEAWKHGLLDISKRNKLMNYRKTKRTTLQITIPSMTELFKRLVHDGDTLSFRRQIDAGNDLHLSQLFYIMDKMGATVELAEGEVRSDLSAAEMNQTLKNLRSKAKLSQEEQGINVLYMSFGFLRWNEKNGAKAFFDAPLILVPVTIAWENIHAPFVLGLHEDEIVFNPTLKFMLEDTYGLKLPEFEHKADLKTYIQKLKEVLDNKEWSIQEEVGVGLFHFLKLSMYDDLKKNEEAILNSNLIRAIAGDSSAVDFTIPDFSNLDSSDELSPMKTFQVVDADSSQQEAVLCAKKGIMYVGKSLCLIATAIRSSAIAQMSLSYCIISFIYVLFLYH